MFEPRLYYDNDQFFKRLTFTSRKRQHHKMVIHVQISRQLQPTNYLSVFDHFVGLGRKGLSFLS